ncbi:deoxycytidylate deaminase [Acinetobacter beijerinckii]|uniref:deoxycytidylate deaminase n=1 Tax=Acinetobacter beijerinckii TaxID=262668 RepID=UPI00405511B6
MNNQIVADAIEHTFNEISNFTIIALTGRTGSGCSTTAKILTTTKSPLAEIGYSHFQGNDARKYRIIKDFLDKNWVGFDWLQVKAIITRFILELDFNSFLNLLSITLNTPLDDIKEKLEHINAEYDEMNSQIIEFVKLDNKSKTNLHEINKLGYELFFETLPLYATKLREWLNSIRAGAYTELYQKVGDNIRASGRADSSDFSAEKMFYFPSIINRAIKYAHYVNKENKKKCFIVIDAIRNPYEIFYLRERYSDFHVTAINTSNENRLRHLKTSRKFTDDQIKALDQKEYPKALVGQDRFISQNIQRCIELADIHINNPRNDLYGEAELASQIGWYVSLIMHPGLVMPTSMETCMQIAYSAKKSSGCISRQVGAVVTDSSYSVKAVGWNNSPQGQVPCLLRSAKHLFKGIDSEAYSKYEKNNENFRKVITEKYIKVIDVADEVGLNIAYCFKDIQNDIEAQKNQVHTRSLHAEENAFLQIAKYGGQSLVGGILFTTASPCELCAKKAYQLGISKIYYIDPYPGIATSHVLESGYKKPMLILFRGAVGSAFHKLYQPVMPYKDELELRFSLKKKIEKKDISLSNLEQENQELKDKILELEKTIEGLKEIS